MPRTIKQVSSPAETSVKAALPDLLTVEQVMTMLGVSRTSLWLLMRKSGLPYIKLGTGRKAGLRFSAESLNQWVKQQERHTPAN